MRGLKSLSTTVVVSSRVMIQKNPTKKFTFWKDPATDDLSAAAWDGVLARVLDQARGETEWAAQSAGPASAGGWEVAGSDGTSVVVAEVPRV